MDLDGLRPPGVDVRCGGNVGLYPFNISDETWFFVLAGTGVTRWSSDH